jgi:polar amino acid transport system substrate-binding protein
MLLVVVASSGATPAADERTVPGFRHVDLVANAQAPVAAETLVLLADQDFAPWSFLGDDGSLAGISVDLARAACAKASLTCSVEPAAFAALQPALQRQQAAAVVTGLRLDSTEVSGVFITRPYFQSLGRFAVRAGSPLAAPDTRTLAGRRVAFVANTAHALFVETYYPRSALMPFATPQEMLEALRTGQVDAAFGDSIQLAYWVKGDASKGCCAFLGKSFLHRESFSRSLFFTVAKNQKALRDRLDDALDKLERDGTTAKIFARYLPGPLW